jgi:hypothetical protein
MKEPVKRKSNLLKMLEELDKEDLIAEIEKLCLKFDVVKNYFEVELSGDASKQLDKAKKEVDKQLYTSAGKPRNPKASRLNKIVRDFEQISIYKEDVIILMVHRIEQTVKFANKYGVNDALYQSTNRVITKVMELVEAEGLEEKYGKQLAAFEHLL